MKVSEIHVGERCRKDMGDIEALAASIAEVGLLQPIVVTSDGRLVAGARRLEAVKLLGWEEVPVHVVRNLDEEHLALKAERDENTCRMKLSPGDAVALGEKYRKQEEEAARKRQLLGIPSVNFTEGSKGAQGIPCVKFTQGKARDKIAAYAEMSWRTYEKAKTIVDAAESEPERFGALLTKMNETGKVNPVYLEYKKLANPVLITTGSDAPQQEFYVDRTKVTEAMYNQIAAYLKFRNIAQSEFVVEAIDLLLRKRCGL